MLFDSFFSFPKYEFLDKVITLKTVIKKLFKRECFFFTFASVPNQLTETVEILLGLYFLLENFGTRLGLSYKKLVAKDCCQNSFGKNNLNIKKIYLMQVNGM